MRNFRNLNIFYISSLLFTSSPYFIKASLHEELLVKHLFTGYNKDIRPCRKFGETTKVVFYLTLLQLISVTEKNEEMTTSLYINLLWEDMRLSWDPKEFNGLTNIRVPSKAIWKPDIALHNNNDGRYDTTVPVNALLNSSGTVEWMPAALYKSACKINVNYFPFDWQNCSMRFKSFAYDKDEMSLISAYDKVVVDSQAYRDNGEWNIVHCPIKTNSHDLDQTYQDITLYFIIQRRALFYIINIIVPSVLISSLSVLVFLLPSASSEKMSMGISVLLGLTVYLLLLAKRVPETSLGIPLAGSYLLFTMFIVVVSLVFSVVVLNCYHWKLTNHPLPPWFAYLFMDFFPRFLKIKKPFSNRRLLMERENSRIISETFSLGTMSENKDDVNSRKISLSNSCCRVDTNHCMTDHHLKNKACEILNEKNLTLDSSSDDSKNKFSSTSASDQLSTSANNVRRKVRQNSKRSVLRNRSQISDSKYENGKNELKTLRPRVSQESENQTVSDRRNGNSFESVFIQNKSETSQRDQSFPESLMKKALMNNSRIDSLLISKHLDIMDQSSKTMQMDRNFQLKTNLKANAFRSVQDVSLRPSSLVNVNNSADFCLQFECSKSIEVRKVVDDSSSKSDNETSKRKICQNRSITNFQSSKRSLYSTTASSHDRLTFSRKKERKIYSLATAKTSQSHRLSKRHHSPEAMTDEEDAALKSNDCKTEIKLACAAIDFVSQRMRQRNRHLLIVEDLHFVAHVLDRLLLIVFFSVFVFGILYYGFKAVSNYPPVYPFDDKDPRFANCLATNSE